MLLYTATSELLACLVAACFQSAVGGKTTSLRRHHTAPQGLWLGLAAMKSQPNSGRMTGNAPTKEKAGLAAPSIGPICRHLRFPAFRAGSLDKGRKAHEGASARSAPKFHDEGWRVPGPIPCIRRGKNETNRLADQPFAPPCQGLEACLMDYLV